MLTKFRLALFVLITILLLSACSNSQETAAPSSDEVATFPPPTTFTPEPTIVPSATATPEPTFTAVPTSTPTLGVKEAGFSAWCAPNSLYATELGYTMPAGAQIARQENGFTEVDGIVQSCTFIYTFNQPIPDGMQVALYDTRPEPWFIYPLTRAADNPAIGYFFTNHEYIVNLPYWEVDYRFELQDAAGVVLRSDEIHILRPQNVGYCFGGYLPDPVTLKCEFLGEAHPWDPWYGWDLDPKLP